MMRTTIVLLIAGAGLWLLSAQPRTRVNAKDGLTYVWIPPGKFQMGCSPADTECFDNEKPAHQVTITKGFWLGQTPVTQQAFLRPPAQQDIAVPPFNPEGYGLARRDFLLGHFPGQAGCDAEAFAACVVSLLRNPEERAALAAGARRTAEASYDWPLLAARQLAVYSLLTTGAVVARDRFHS